MKSTRFSGKISSDPTKKSGRKTPLPYKAKTGIFSPAAPKKPAPRPARPADLPPLRPARRAPPPPGGFGPVCPRAAPPRRRATARPARPRPPQAPCARTGAAPFLPRRRPAPPAFARREAAAAPRARRAPPKARRRPARAQKKARRPRRAPGRPRAPAPAERPAPPRGDRIPGRGFEGTAAPSRVNFREIRDPGVTPQKSKNARKNPAKKRKAAAHADRCLKWLDKLPHHAEVVFFRIEYGQYADDLLRFINAVEDQIILMQDVAKVKATQNAVFR